MIEAQPLPYDFGDLEPWLSADTLELHYGLYQRYVQRVLGYYEVKKKLAPPTLDDVLEGMRQQPDDRDPVLLHNLQQAMNHELLWESMTPYPKKPIDPLSLLLKRRWNTHDAFVTEWLGKAVGMFGSGWTWLVIQNDRLEIVSTPNSDQPWQLGEWAPLLVLDVWEHAYVCDWGGHRQQYVEGWLDRHINWAAASEYFMLYQTQGVSVI